MNLLYLLMERFNEKSKVDLRPASMSNHEMGYVFEHLLRKFNEALYGYEWSKDYDAVSTREPMQNNPSVRQRLASAASNRKPCRHRFLHPSPLPLCNAASPPTRRGQQSGISGHFDLKEASHERGTHCPFS